MIGGPRGPGAGGAAAGRGPVPTPRPVDPAPRPSSSRRLKAAPRDPYPEFVPLLNKVRTAASGGFGGDTAARSLSRLRLALTLFFALDGFLFAGWVVRIPAVKQQTGATAGDLGLALLGVSAGAVITMTLTGRLCRRHGSHAVTVATAVLLSLSVALPALTRSPLALGLVLLVFGAASLLYRVSRCCDAVLLARRCGESLIRVNDDRCHPGVTWGSARSIA